MSAWTAAFWIWVALDVGIALGWVLRTALPSDHPRQDHIHPKQEDHHE
jgi:hypothetical protein